MTQEKKELDFNYVKLTEVTEKFEQRAQNVEKLLTNKDFSCFIYNCGSTIYYCLENKKYEKQMKNASRVTSICFCRENQSIFVGFENGHLSVFRHAYFNLKYQETELKISSSSLQFLLMKPKMGKQTILVSSQSGEVFLVDLIESKLGLHLQKELLFKNFHVDLGSSSVLPIQDSVLALFVEGNKILFCQILPSPTKVHEGKLSKEYFQNEKSLGVISSYFELEDRIEVHYYIFFDNCLTHRVLSLTKELGFLKEEERKKFYSFRNLRQIVTMRANLLVGITDDFNIKLLDMQDDSLVGTIPPYENCYQIDVSEDCFVLRIKEKNKMLLLKPRSLLELFEEFQENGDYIQLMKLLVKLRRAEKGVAFLEDFDGEQLREVAELAAKTYFKFFTYKLEVEKVT